MRGFEYLVYSAFSLTLLLTLVLLPLAPVFADETESGTASESSIDTETEPRIDDDEESSQSSSVDDSPEVFEEETIPLEVINQDERIDTLVNDTSPPSEFELDNQDENSDADRGSEPVVEEQSTIEELPVDEQAVVTMSTEASTTITSADEEVVSTIDTVTDTELVHEVMDVEATSTTIEVAVSEQVATTTPMEEPTPELEKTISDIGEETDETSTTTVESAENLVTVDSVSVNTLTNDENRFSFAKSECTVVGDGTFYCAKAEEKSLVIHTDRVFSAQDSFGDKEIYIEKNSVVTQVSNNDYDDDAPYYDEESNSLVWHRLVNGRYQIISYDIDEEAEEQITNDRFNNMEPNRSGEATVWQGWVGNDWEVFLLDDGELSMITDNTTHDVAPSINDNHIVWQAFENGVWKMKLYNIEKKTVDTIEDADGASIKNPRFVLVYDTKYENGDTETRGYDLKSGEVIELGATPPSIPEEIPDPEQTGEERALVSPTVQPKSKIDGEDDDDTLLPEIPPVDADENSDIVIPPLVTLGSVVTPSSTPEIIIPEIDLTAPEVTLDSTPVEHIPDLIITPFVEPFSETIIIEDLDR